MCQPGCSACPLPPPPPLRDVPSGLASGPWLCWEHVFCRLWLKKDEPAVLPALCGEEGGALCQPAPHRVPATGRVTKALACAPHPTGHFPLRFLVGEGRAPSTGGSAPQEGISGHGRWALEESTPTGATERWSVARRADRGAGQRGSASRGPGAWGLSGPMGAASQAGLPAAPTKHLLCARPPLPLRGHGDQEAGKASQSGRQAPEEKGHSASRAMWRGASSDRGQGCRSGPPRLRCYRGRSMNGWLPSGERQRKTARSCPPLQPPCREGSVSLLLVFLQINKENRDKDPAFLRLIGSIHAFLSVCPLPSSLPPFHACM